jgi:hypothetical protein
LLAELGDPAFTLLGKSLHSNTPTGLPEATSGAGSDLHCCESKCPLRPEAELGVIHIYS